MRRKCKNKNIHKPSALFLVYLFGFCYSCPPNQRETAMKLKHFVHSENFSFLKCLTLNQSDQCEKHSCRECGVMICSVRNDSICLLHIKAWHSFHVSPAVLKPQLYNHKQAHIGAQLFCRSDCILEFYVHMFFIIPVQLQLLPFLPGPGFSPTLLCERLHLFKKPQTNLITAYFDHNSV